MSGIFRNIQPTTIDGAQFTSDGRQRVTAEKPEGSRKTAITPNFCDRTSWYWKSKKQTALTLVDQGSQTVYKDESDTVTYPWIDNYHGKYFREDFLENEDGQIPRMKVYVNGQEKTEDDPAHPGEVVEYRVTYVVPKSKRFPVPGLTDRPRDRRVWETAVTARYEGDRSDDLVWLSIDASEVPTGIHKLTVTVRDLQSGQTAERSTLFRLVD